MLKRSISLLLVLIACLTPGQLASAFFSPARVNTPTADKVWIGGSGPNWSTADNWLPSGAPQNGDRLGFQANAISNNNLTNLSVAGLGFEGSGIQVSGNPLTISAGLLSLEPATVNLQLPLNTSGNITADLASGSTVTISGAVSGSGMLTKSGTGALILSGANTFSGGLTISGGTVTLRHNSAAGGGPVHQLASTTLILGVGANTIANPLFLNGISGGDPCALRVENTASTDKTLTGLVTYASTASLCNFGSYWLTLSGGLTGNGDLYLENGKFRFGGPTASTYIGKLSISAAQLELMGPAGTTRVTGALSIGPGISSVNRAEVVAQASDLFSASSQVTFSLNSRLNLNAFNQTITGLGRPGSDQPCELHIDSPAVLTIQHTQGLLNYFWCDATGTGKIQVSGAGLQDFGKSVNAFDGTLEILPSATSYLDEFKTTGPYILRSGTAGGMYPKTSAGGLLVEDAWFYLTSADLPDTPRAANLSLTGTNTFFNIMLYSQTSPALISNGLVSLGGVRSSICYGEGTAGFFLPELGVERLLIQNNSLQPISGTLKDLLEGAQGTLVGCFGQTGYPIRISYQAGDGNDLSIWRLAPAILSLYINPSNPQPGQSVTITVRLQSAGMSTYPTNLSLVINDGANPLGTVTPGADGYAVLPNVPFGVGLHALSVSLTGDTHFTDTYSDALIFRNGWGTFLPFLCR